MSPVLGLRANVRQFALLVAVSALVGGMVGQERTVLPLLATDVFGLRGFVSALTFVIAFGIAKAFTNLAAGALVDRFGRKPVLVAGWLVGLPVPILIILAPSWGWIVAANLLLGVNQGLTWSTTVIMKIDLVGPIRRGLATGINEAAGYGAVAFTALVTGWIAAEYGLRPGPFLLGLAYACLGLGASALFVHETRGHVEHEQAMVGRPETLRWREVFWRTTVHDRNLSAVSQAGLVNNLNDGMAWGLLPLFYASAGLSIGEIGVLAATLPGGVGGRSGRHRRAVRQDRPKAAHRRRHVGSGGRDRRHRVRVDLQRLVPCVGHPRSWDRDGLSDATRFGRRRGRPGLAWFGHRCLPTLA